jgi:hypothetical protein
VYGQHYQPATNSFKPGDAPGTCLANLCRAVLATVQGRLAAAGEWGLNEKR